MSKIKDDPQKMWKRRIIDMELNYHARPIQKNVGLSRKKKSEKSYQRLYLGSPKSFKDWKMLKYEVKSSSRSFCRAWDRVITGSDDSDRLDRNLSADRLRSKNQLRLIARLKVRLNCGQHNYAHFLMRHRPEKFHRPYRHNEKAFGVLLRKHGPTVPHRLLHH
ncbi:hypothetical protein TNCV_3845801 [Trichonephila clavipes]|nr:hypothetical protein TNCV_3845801 [Trichonephila clavipes]